MDGTAGVDWGLTGLDDNQLAAVMEWQRQRYRRLKEHGATDEDARQEAVADAMYFAREFVVYATVEIVGREDSAGSNRGKASTRSRSQASENGSGGFVRADGRVTLGGTTTEDVDRIIRETGESEPGWLRAAVQAVTDIASVSEKFTTDDVWAELESRGVDAPRERRVMGSAMRVAKQAGVCRSAGEWRASTRPESHSRPVMVWRSLVRC